MNYEARGFKETPVVLFGREVYCGVARAETFTHIGVMWMRLSAGILFYFGIGGVFMLYLCWWKAK